jgi:hypothetical protein
MRKKNQPNFCGAVVSIWSGPRCLKSRLLQKTKILRKQNKNELLIEATQMIGVQRQIEKNKQNKRQNLVMQTPWY